MKKLYAVIFFGIVGCFKLIHLDLLYGNRLISPEKYEKETNEASKSVDGFVEAIRKDVKDAD